MNPRAPTLEPVANVYHAFLLRHNSTERHAKFQLLHAQARSTLGPGYDIKQRNRQIQSYT